ncbi:MAG: ATP-binding protein [bacterium]|nr:ATP-binding protein [bacterium]
MTTKKRLLKEEFAHFYENPTLESLRELLKNNLGEFPNLDFKEVWLPSSQMARHILAIANAGGGCIVIGVAEKDDKTLEANGIESLTDKAIIINGIKKYIPDVLLEEIEIGDFPYDASEYPKLVNKKFQVVIVPSDLKRLPYISMAEGDSIKNNAIYTRRGTSSVEVNYAELQKIINSRLETGYSSRTEIDLQAHIEHLKMLYGQIDKYHVRVTGGIYETLQVFAENVNVMMGTRERVPNPNYPDENLEEFIVKMINKKKKRIEILLDTVDL